MPAPIVIEQLRLTLSEDKLELAGTLAGEIAPVEVAQHFRRVHERLVASRSASYEIDVRRLTLANASALRLFVDWITRASSAGYRLVFRLDGNVTWHRLSFEVLKSLAPSTVQIVGLAGASTNPERDSR
jgi:ABC-type transporter Mla MlaB component